MQRENWVLEFEEDIEKLENRYNKFFVWWQKTFAEEEGKQRTTKLKVRDNKLRKIEQYIKTLKDIKRQDWKEK